MSTKQSNLPELTVVVLNWNGCSDLRDCLSSLQQCGYPLLNIICVDNASTDNSVEIVREEFPDIDIQITPENLRWAGGNNYGLNNIKQKTPYTLLLNNDTIVPYGSLNILVDTAIKKNAWAITPRICFADDQHRIWYDGGLVGKNSGWVRHSGIREKVEDCSVDVKTNDYATGCALLLSEECIDAVGAFDESFFLYSEDVDYSLRILNKEQKIWHDPNSVIFHKVSKSIGNDSPTKAYLKIRSNFHLIKKHSKVFNKWSVIPIQVILIFSTCLWFLLRGLPSTALAVVKAAFDELRNAPQNVEL